MIDIDKFLTDLAAHAGCDVVIVSHVKDQDVKGNKFRVSLIRGGLFVQRTGPTVNDAMNAALAAKCAREAEFGE